MFSTCPQEHYFDCPYQLSSEAIGQTSQDALVFSCFFLFLLKHQQYDTTIVMSVIYYFTAVIYRVEQYLSVLEDCCLLILIPFGFMPGLHCKSYGG